MTTTQLRGNEARDSLLVADVNAKFNRDGVLIRMLWVWDLCVSSTELREYWNGTLGFQNESLRQIAAEFQRHKTFKYRSCSFLRYDLPVALCNGRRLCPCAPKLYHRYRSYCRNKKQHRKPHQQPMFQIGIILDPSTVGRGCAFYSDGDTDHKMVDPGGGVDAYPQLKICERNRTGCSKRQQCCFPHWENAARMMTECKGTDHNEFLAAYSYRDIMAIFYTVYTDQTTTRTVDVYELSMLIKRSLQLDLSIMELHVPSPIDQWPVGGAADIQFYKQATPTSMAPFSMVT